MKKKLLLAFGTLFPVIFTGCGFTGEKSIQLSVVYAVCGLLSVVTLSIYCAVCKKRDPWFLLMFVSVLVVNLGYFVLSVSGSLAGALWANRISYFGSVFLPFAMLMIILNTTKVKYKRYLPIGLCLISIFVFFIAASPGILTIYYKEVSLSVVNGITVLNKVYGPLHILYLFYLVGYFTAMLVIIVRGFVKKSSDSIWHSVFIAMAVLVNLGVWFLEQLVRFEFEMLSISYIMSEIFLIGLCFLMKEQEKLKELVKLREMVQEFDFNCKPISHTAAPQLSAEDQERVELFVSGFRELTKTEKAVFDGYVSRLTTNEIMESLNIKENTLKFHNKNLYGKLGVTSRKQLMAVYEQVKTVNQHFE